ncbi:uncharacterized protein LOC124392386 isoform X2 [Silurus meridionalis]|uniref:uncharacterized protein LOC124392386 isoform X2 n=1 Tax=Silurus meridionalis TaxID=175797 RepID=UPI001EE9FFAA|nr:uncharacterized protein LOC124392386 isoform X2 [Silurus meridionalis]
MPDDPGVIPQSMMEALELFCNLPEQSYEQFLSTFTHLSTEKVTADCPMVPEEENKTCLVKLNNRDGVNMDRKTEAELATEGLHNTEDVHVLPGEVEEDLPAYTPAYCHRTQLELSSTDMDHWTHTPPSNTESQICRATTSFTLPRAKARTLCLSVWMTPLIMTMSHCLTSILSNPAPVDHHDLNIMFTNRAETEVQWVKGDLTPEGVRTLMKFTLLIN